MAGRCTCNHHRQVQYIDALSASPVFAGLERSALSEISDALTLESWPKGCQILAPSSPADRFRIILRGRVKMTRSNGANGRDLTLWLLARGDGFDIVPLLDGEPHAASASALDDVQTLAVPIAQFCEWMERFPALRRAMCRYVAQQMRELTELASELALHDTMTRLARLLLRHFDDSGRSGTFRPNLIQDLSHEELASLVGSVRVVVNRLIGQLKREGAICLANGRLHIADLKRLMRHAEMKLELGRPKMRTRAGSVRPQ